MNRREKGYFWYIIDENGSNCGFGYADTTVRAFSDAKAELRRFLSKPKDGIEEGIENKH